MWLQPKSKTSIVVFSTCSINSVIDAFKSHCAILGLMQGNKFKEAEELFMTLLNEEKSPLKPDQKMFHMMIYMHKKAGNYEKARKIFALMAERGVEQSTVTYNSLMSFENNYKEVSNIYNQVKFMNQF